MNYFDDNWLCIVNIAPRPILFTHLFEAKNLMTTSPSHIKAQKVNFRTLMQIKAHD
jgi:hypothetical protein